MFTPKPQQLFTYKCTAVQKIDGLPHGPSSSQVCCVVGGCFRDVVVMCSEFIGQRVELRNQTEVWGRKHIDVLLLARRIHF